MFSEKKKKKKCEEIFHPHVTFPIASDIFTTPHLYSTPHRIPTPLFNGIQKAQILMHPDSHFRQAISPRKPSFFPVTAISSD